VSATQLAARDKAMNQIMTDLENKFQTEISKQRTKAIYKALLGLWKAIRFDSSIETVSESDTEALFLLLGTVFCDEGFAEMDTILEQSHKDGLCYDMATVIADRINEEIVGVVAEVAQ
jgi:hypothetical protein